MGDLALSRILSAFSSRVRAGTAGVFCLVLAAVRGMEFERNRVGELLVSTVAMAKVFGVGNGGIKEELDGVI